MLWLRCLGNAASTHCDPQAYSDCCNQGRDRDRLSSADSDHRGHTDVHSDADAYAYS